MKFVPKSISRTVGRSVLEFKKDSPHIFFGIGVIGVGVSTVLACRATLKLHQTMDEIAAEVEEAHVEDASPRDKVYIYTKSACRIGKLYAPSAVVGVVSIAALTGSHVQMTRRNTALTAAYAGVAKAYDEYRSRVQAELGEEKEAQIYYGTDTEEVVDEKGKTQTIKTIGDVTKISPYARFFDESSSAWEKDAEINRMFLECQQRFANDLLLSRGHIFLNEVYDMLGLERSRMGALVGWVHGSDGDGYVDFGMYRPENARFLNGNERSVFLDFNVDGIVYDKI